MGGLLLHKQHVLLCEGTGTTTAAPALDVTVLGFGLAAAEAGVLATAAEGVGLVHWRHVLGLQRSVTD